ncbi:uncharacterized protein LOC108039173 [Drosophila rhopaloa]|uniref:Uncharacterized protein n=2 Tax=Drosophila rhopaloa TaxID=1041015 RepID=A0ABM5J3J1_DRORH|nr:uncharacterized protein LOC108039173 [Drosophila rhopaloa]
MRKGHTVSKCKFNKCRVCGRSHHVLLHRYTVSENSLALPPPQEILSPSLNQDQPSTSHVMHATSLDRVILATSIVRWAPRMSPSRPLRQRDELRRSESPLPGPSREDRGRSRRDTRIRIKKRMRICLHTTAGSAHGRTMGGRCQNCQEPTPTGGGQRAPKRRRAGDSPRGNRGGDELPAARSDQQRPKRRRGADTRAPTDRRAATRHTSTPDPGPGGSQLLAAMAACLVSQANVLAAMVSKYGASGTSSSPTSAREISSSWPRTTCRPNNGSSAE